MLYKLLITKSKSEDFFTGKKRLLGTFTPKDNEMKPCFTDIHNHEINKQLLRSKMHKKINSNKLSTYLKLNSHTSLMSKFCTENCPKKYILPSTSIFKTLVSHGIGSSQSCQIIKVLLYTSYRSIRMWEILCLPTAPEKSFMAAPAAVSSCKTFNPLSRVCLKQK